MNQSQHTAIVNFIWGIADDCLRDVYVRGKYRDVILPMTVIRRIDALLEPAKQAVLKMKEQLDKAKVTNQHPALCQAAGQAFYNTSPFVLRDLKSRSSQQKLKADFEAYLDGFSPNVQEILEKFKFRNQIPTMIESDILGLVIEKFTNTEINLSPNPVLDVNGNVRLPALDNHSMGMIFEELIRRFNEENNEEAGEHFTPRDVVKLMADLVLLPIADRIESGTYLLYDGAQGTGGEVIPIEKLNKVSDMWFSAMITQVTNIPVDMRIEKWIFDNYPELRKSQEVSIDRQMKEGAAVLSKRIQELTPKKIYDASNHINCSFAISMENLLGKKYTAPYRKTPFIDLGTELADLVIRSDDKGFNQDIQIIDQWTDMLGLKGWYNWIDFEDIPPNYLESP